MTLFQIYVFGFFAFPIVAMARFATSERIRDRLMMTKGYDPKRHAFALILGALLWPVAVPFIVITKIARKFK